MSATVEQIKQRPELRALRADIPATLGAAACAGCPLAQLGCPGKPEASAECPPPQARVLTQQEVLPALFDDSVESIATSGGELYAQVVQQPQRKLVVSPSRPPARPVAPQIPAKKVALTPERRRPVSPGFFTGLGQLAAAAAGSFLSAKPAALAKK